MNALSPLPMANGLCIGREGGGSSLGILRSVVSCVIISEGSVPVEKGLGAWRCKEQERWVK